MAEKKTQNEKVIERVRKGHLRETKAHRMNALRASPERLHVTINAKVAAATRAANLPTGQITRASAAKIDRKTAVQLDMFGG